MANRERRLTKMSQMTHFRRAADTNDFFAISFDVLDSI